jgi:nitroreductase
MSNAAPDREAPAAHPIEAVIRRRWSPRSYTSQPVSAGALHSLLEAARWAASCFNVQPWNLVVVRKEQDAAAHAALVECLSANNQRWAGAAPVLILACASTTFPQNGQANRHAWYDTGAAMAQLAVQAVALGMQAHQMAGFDAAKAREAMGVPEGFDPISVTSIGYAGSPDALPDDLKQRETAPRVRRTVEEITHLGGWKA